jgi:hypothetical protein
VVKCAVVPPASLAPPRAWTPAGTVTVYRVDGRNAVAGVKIALSPECVQVPATAGSMTGFGEPALSGPLNSTMTGAAPFTPVLAVAGVTDITRSTAASGSVRSGPA